MNIMKIIIGSTFALLIAGLVISYSSMKKNEVHDPEAIEIAQLEKRLAQLESAEIKAKSNVYTGSTAPTSPLEAAALSHANLSEMEQVRNELRELKSEREAIEDKAEKVIADAIGAKPADPRRTNLIKSALVMARISEYDNINKIAGIDILRVGNVNPGDTLGIRRNNTIIGKLTIGMIDLNQGIADPLSSTFPKGIIDIQVGDELILPPAF